MEPILYKKKITTITTEYYKILDELVKTESTQPEVYNGSELLYPPPGQAPTFDKEVFSSNVKSYFESYGRKMKDMLTAVTGTEEQLASAEENMFADIWAISSLLRPFYSAEFCEKILQSLRAIGLFQLQIVDGARRGIDTKVWQDRVPAWPINDLAVNLNLYNNALDKELVRSFWSSTYARWTEALQAKLDKDDLKFDQAIAKADESLGNFANALSRAIIDKHPQMFITPITVAG